MTDAEVVALVFYSSLALFLIALLFHIVSSNRRPPMQFAAPEPPAARGAVCDDEFPSAIEWPAEASASAVPINEVESEAQLYPTGREVFFPEPPHAKAVYEITFSGMVSSARGR